MSMCNVIGVLGDDECQMWRTLDVAVSLATRERARLTLAKTCDGAQAYIWATPFAVGGGYVPQSLESPDEAARILSTAVESVPESIPVTTVVLCSDTQRALITVLRGAHFGALVAPDDLLRHCRRLRRRLRDDGTLGVAITLRPPQQPFGGRITDFQPNKHPEDGGIDGGQFDQTLRDRWHGSLRRGTAQRLAGAGGEQ